MKIETNDNLDNKILGEMHRLRRQHAGPLVSELLDRAILSVDERGELAEAILFLGNSPAARRLPADELWRIALVSSFAGRFVDDDIPVEMTVNSKPIELPDLPAEKSPIS